MAWKGSITTVVTSDTAQTIETINITEGAENLWFEITNGTNPALDEFVIQVRPHASASFHTVASATSDYVTQIQEPIVGADRNMTALGRSDVGMVWMHVKGSNAVRLKASSSSISDATLITYWQVR